MGYSVRAVGGILVSLDVAEKRRDTFDKLLTFGGYSDKRVYRLCRKIFAKHSPAGNSSVVGRTHRRHSANALHYFKAAQTTVLPSVPEVR